MGCRMTSWPWLFNSAASALSRMQLPQYICAAPAVKARIFIADSDALEGAARVQVIEQIAFVRLIPADARGRNGAQIQPSDVGGSEQARNQLAVVRDRGNHQ